MFVLPAATRQHPAPFSETRVNHVTRLRETRVTRVTFDQDGAAI